MPQEQNKVEKMIFFVTIPRNYLLIHYVVTHEWLWKEQKYSPLLFPTEEFNLSKKKKMTSIS